MDKSSSSTKDDTSLSQSNRDKSVSELLSSYYSIADDSHQGVDGPSDSKFSKTTKSATVTDKEFLSHSFDVEFHLDNILRNNSISDAVSFLRKLERETRQLTAGKQLLIYDNYECLFSALDTLQGINRDLDAVESNLRNLNASQIKAASKDITSKYGIRDRFLQISQLSKASNVFKFLGHLCSTLASFNNSNTLFYSNDDESSNVLKCSPKDVLYFCSRVYYIFKYFDSSYPFLFSNYYTLLTDLVSRNTTALLLGRDPIHSDDLFQLCNSLKDLEFNNTQLLEFYFYKISSLLESKMKNLFINYTNDDFSFTALCKEVFESLLQPVYESVSNEKFVSFFHSLKMSKDRPKFCFYCVDDLKVDFNNDDPSDLFSSFNLFSTEECSCLADDLDTQFVIYYSQASFYIFTYLISSYSYPLVTKDVSTGLTSLFGRLYTLEAKNKKQGLFLDQSLNWLMLVCVLYLQYLFFKLYDSVISKSISLLNGSYNSDLNSKILTSFEKLVQELFCLDEFVKDVSSTLKNNFEQVFNSLLAVYTCGLKYIYHLIFVNINSGLFNATDVNHLDSISNLISLRSFTEKNREHVVEDLLKQTSLRLSESDGLSHTFKDQCLFSVLEFMDKNIKSQLKKFKYDSTRHKTYTKNLLSFLIKFGTVFGAVVGVLEKHFKQSFKMFKEANVAATLKFNKITGFQELRSVMRDQVLKNTNYVKFQTIFDEFIETGSVPLLNILFLSHEYYKSSRRLFPFKLNETSSNDSNNSASTETNGAVNTNASNDDVVDSTKHRTHSIEEQVYKRHFETFNISIEQLTNDVISNMMFDYIDKSMKIIRYVLDNLERGNDVIDASVKDFTILLSDVLQDVNLLNMAQMSAEVSSQNKELDKALNSSLNSPDMSPLVNVYMFKFNTSRDMCLKLFTMHVVQCLAQYKATYSVDESLLTRFYDALKQQILIIFKKNLDLFIMQSAWEKVINVS